MLNTTTEIFNEINSDIFADSLDIPEFLFLDDSENYGWYIQYHTKDFININPKYCLTYIHIFGTIAHEMIHLWQYTIENKHWKQVGHRLDFRKKALEIENFYKLEWDTV